MQHCVKGIWTVAMATQNTNWERLWPEDKVTFHTFQIKHAVINSARNRSVRDNREAFKLTANCRLLTHSDFTEHNASKFFFN